MNSYQNQYDIKAKLAKYNNLKPVEEPKNFTLEVLTSYKCNLNCEYCAWHTDSEFIPVKTVEKALQKVNAQHLVLVGGEPLLHPEINTLASLTQSKIYTNGLLLKRLKVSCEVGVSVHLEKLLERNINVISFIRNVVENYNADIDIILSYNAIKNNLNLVKFLAKRYDIEFVFQDLIKISQDYKSIFNQHDKSVIVDNKLLSEPEVYIQGNNFKGYKCYKGLHSCVIDPKGNLYNCLNCVHFNKSTNIGAVIKCPCDVCFHLDKKCLL